MKHKIRPVVGILIFGIACVLPIWAIWRYTGAGLSADSFRISASIFHAVLAVALVLFYLQWKVCPSIWGNVKFWFSDHAWSIMFAVTLIIIAQSLLFYRFYTLSYKRYMSLSSDLKNVIENQVIINKQHSSSFLEIIDLANQCKNLETYILDVKKTINNLDVPQKKRQTRQMNRTWY